MNLIQFFNPLLLISVLFFSPLAEAAPWSSIEDALAKLWNSRQLEYSPKDQACNSDQLRRLGHELGNQVRSVFVSPTRSSLFVHSVSLSSPKAMLPDYLKKLLQVFINYPYEKVTPRKFKRDFSFFPVMKDWMVHPGAVVPLVCEGQLRTNRFSYGKYSCDHEDQIFAAFLIQLQTMRHFFRSPHDNAEGFISESKDRRKALDSLNASISDVVNLNGERGCPRLGLLTHSKLSSNQFLIGQLDDIKIREQYLAILAEEENFTHQQKLHCYAIHFDTTNGAFVGGAGKRVPANGFYEFTHTSDRLDQKDPEYDYAEVSGRIIWDYLEKRVYYTPSHYKPWYRVELPGELDEAVALLLTDRDIRIKESRLEKLDPKTGCNGIFEIVR